jgi:alpha-tubulin suppressor-like RCC1 family protein
MLSNKLKYYFENKIKIWLKCKEKIFILNKSEYFYEIDIYDKQISKFIETNDNSIIESMIVKELCNKNIIDLSYGFSHYIARTYDNKFYCWGNNYFGQLGFGSEDQNEFHKNIPKLNNFLSDLNINAIKCGVNHSLALTQSGEVYGWGCNEFGQIGCGDNNVKVMPTKVTGLNENKIKMISCGENHSLALTESGCVYSWGDNSRGALGIENGSWTVYRQPVYRHPVYRHPVYRQPVYRHDHFIDSQFIDRPFYRQPVYRQTVLSTASLSTASLSTACFIDTQFNNDISI